MHTLFVLFATIFLLNFKNKIYWYHILEYPEIHLKLLSQEGSCSLFPLYLRTDVWRLPSSVYMVWEQKHILSAVCDTLTYTDLVIKSYNSVSISIPWNMTVSGSVINTPQRYELLLHIMGYYYMKIGKNAIILCKAFHII